jgi:uncharacterized RDD family membrane protein YckC
MEKQIKPVDFGRRIGALIIDLVLFSLYAFIVISIYLAFISGQEDSGFRGNMNATATLTNHLGSPLMMLFFVVSLALYWLPEFLNGNSFGKKMIGIVCRNTKGESISQKQRITRFVIKHSYWMVLFLGLFFYFHFYLR